MNAIIILLAVFSLICLVVSWSYAKYATKALDEALPMLRAAQAQAKQADEVFLNAITMLKLASETVNAETDDDCGCTGFDHKTSCPQHTIPF
jgi:uncharacterized membrane protein